MEVLILGCGPSGGVPNITTGWGNCNPNNIKNKRLRSSILIYCDDGKCILIDTSPDLREQLLSANCKKIDAILYTHGHADHCHGIDSIRWIAYKNKHEIPAYSNISVLKELKKNFSYVFDDSNNLGYRPFIKAFPVKDTFFIGKNKITIFDQKHGTCGKSYGFVINDKLVYSTDLVDFPKKSYDLLSSLNIEVWIVGVIGEKQHHNHLHLEKVITLESILHPKKTFLTHMGQELDYEYLQKKLPPYIYPCFDGMRITL